MTIHLRTKRCFRQIGVATVLAFLASSAALATTAAFRFAAFGSFAVMDQTGDTSAKVRLTKLPQRSGYWGLGALAGMTGEVLLHDGHLLVSPGSAVNGGTRSPVASDGATMFGFGRVREWRSLTVPRDMDFGELKAFVLSEAGRQGHNPAQPFPFLVEGLFPSLSWHVVTGPSPAPMHNFEQSTVTGRLVGIYSGEAFEGVITHKGNRFHIHYVDRTLAHSGHVDAIRIAAGTVLKLPVR